MNYYSIEDMKKDAAKDCYVWVGQNATTGQPHPITGKMSMYGSLLKFKTRQQAREYADNYYNHCNPSEYAVAGTVNALRKYHQGMSWYNYLCYCLTLDCAECNR